MLTRSALLALSGAIMMLSAAFTQPAHAALVADPSGDVFNTGTIDVTGVTTTVFAGSVQFIVNFASPVAAPSAFAPNSLLGFVDLDTDQNSGTGGNAPWGGPVTGGNSWINFFIPPNPGTPSVPGPFISLGDEFYVDLRSELFHPGVVDIISASTNAPTGVAPIAFGGTSVTFSIPFGLIGNDNGLLNFGLLVGDFVSPTDRVTNGAVPGSTVAQVPEPVTVLLVGIGLIALLRLSRGASGVRRRTQQAC